MADFLKYGLRALIIVLAQVLIFNEVNVGGYINPLIYPMLILMIPFQVSNYLLILIGFAVGLSIDIFTGTIGMHAASLTLMAFIRPGLLNLLNPKREDIFDLPDIPSQGLSWFASYTIIFIFIHHMAYFIIEAGSLTSFYLVIFRILLSTVVSSLIIILLNILLLNRGK